MNTHKTANKPIRAGILELLWFPEKSKMKGGHAKLSSLDYSLYDGTCVHLQLTT